MILVLGFQSALPMTAMTEILLLPHCIAWISIHIANDGDDIGLIPNFSRYLYFNPHANDGDDCNSPQKSLSIYELFRCESRRLRPPASDSHLLFSAILYLFPAILPSTALDTGTSSTPSRTPGTLSFQSPQAGRSSLPHRNLFPVQTTLQQYYLLLLLP